MFPTNSSSSFLDRLAFIISALGSPFVVITAFSIWIAGSYSYSWDQFLLWGTTAIVFTIWIPILYISYGVRTGRFTDMHVMIREQRAEPFLIAIASSFLLIGVFWLERAPRELVALALVLCVTGLFFYLVTTVWKISIHAAAYTGSVVITSLLVTPKACWFLLFLPLIVWSRLYRHRHNIAQSLVAALLVALLIVSVLWLARVL